MRAALIVLGHCLLAGSSFAVDFDKDIRPLLQERCVECHGDKKQKGELRLDAKVFAFKGGHDGAAIVPGSSAKSPMFLRVTSKDDDERMPPKGKPLTAQQIDALKVWIDAGAVWPENATDKAAAVDKRMQHWSVQPVKKDFMPGANIDSFIREALAANGLKMSPEADRRTLIRRLSFDLLGLPPTPERVEQFIRDKDPRAYEKLVDELLASPHYGERWARHWLDIAHYADTHGFERDQLRPNAWRYRDYVIQSLNADKPYNRFLTEQIAGDALPPDPKRQTRDAVVATGFLAAGPWDFVGQVETKSDMLKRAARAGDLDDMVTQVITSTMAITINCARCHDHKLDPILQEEYYSLWAVFAGVKRDNREVDPAESARIRSDLARLQSELATVNGEIARFSGEGLDLADMVGGGNGRGTGTKGAGIVLETGDVTTRKLGMQLKVVPNTLRPALFDPKTARTGFIKGVFLPQGLDNETVSVADGVVLKEYPATSGQAWDAIRNGPLNAQVHSTINGIDYSTNGHSVLGLHANAGITFDLSEIRKQHRLASLNFTAMLGFGANAAAATSKAGFTVYVDSERVLHRTGLHKTDAVPVNVPVPETARFLTLVATDGGDGISSDLLFLGDASLRPVLQPETLTDVGRRQLDRFKEERDRLQKAIEAMPKPAEVYAVVSQEQPPVVRVQKRGNPEDEAQEVIPAAFQWAKHAPPKFGDQSTPEGKRRLALASWITHPDNPLTPRVLVNRLWHHHFGQGIVTTPSDFGLGGDKPSHPELLDWLANEFLKSGGSIKAMHRLICNSATYKQDSTEANKGGKGASASWQPSVRKDSGNRLLWRQNPRRLDAESLHDAVLAVSGNLNTEMGGPGYRDFKYTEAYAPIYDYTTPDKPELWRRSIYRFIVRTTPHQFMSTLDCPDPANLTPARARTTTALQALTLSNNEFMLQQAGKLALRIEKDGTTGKAAIQRAFQSCLQRNPSPTEQKAASQLVGDQGLFPLCRMLMNANEFVYVD
ncbi:MAG TPA: DUF1553 domain-containing protein [Roseimicrobium sp.]|nr:DUF1553 domain-containing protein [Roseimicrobium sp.]